MTDMKTAVTCELDTRVKSDVKSQIATEGKSEGKNDSLTGDIIQGKTESMSKKDTEVKSEVKTDPRILRTRKLIMDSFIELSERKEFKDITVKDITTEAMINRATFYYHFEDIYDLLEKALFEVLSVNLNYVEYEHRELDEEALTLMFKAITSFQSSLSNRCHRGYEDTIARIIRDQLEVIFYKMLKKYADVDQSDNFSGRIVEDKDDALKKTAMMLSWGLYGISTEWRRLRTEIPPEQYIKSAIPYMLNGIGGVRE